MVHNIGVHKSSPQQAEAQLNVRLNAGMMGSDYSCVLTYVKRGEGQSEAKVNNVAYRWGMC